MRRPLVSDSEKKTQKNKECLEHVFFSFPEGLGFLCRENKQTRGVTRVLLAPVICPELDISHLCGLVSFSFLVCFFIRLVAHKSKRSVEDVSECCRCRSRAQSLRRRYAGEGRKEGRERTREETGGRMSGDVIGGRDSPRKTHPGFISHQRVYFGAPQLTCSANDALVLF